MPRYIEKVEKLTLPVIPLRGIVAFPSIPVNFELEREISKSACRAASNDDMYVFLLTQKELNTEDPKQDDLYTVGTVAKIKQSIQKPQNGNIRVIAEGMCRATVQSIRSEGGHLVGDVISKTLTGDYSTLDLRTEAMMTEAMNTVESLLRYAPNTSDDFMITCASLKNPGLLADFIASNVLMRYADKMGILEMFDPMKRLEKLILTMENQMLLMDTERDIQRKVKQAMDENQRDYY
ncbi:MAG: LON peptidase substrate-binding domain-containing protein, partial [Clostridia bacterium]|nr:LON peptidase substrate-binding domain-containing protein [Clostridia bacterium]